MRRLREIISPRKLGYNRNKPKIKKVLRRALKEGYQMSIEDVGFTDVPFQRPIATGRHPHSRWNRKIDIAGYLTKHIKLDLPIVSSSMPGVTNYNVATCMMRHGGFAVLPREMSIDKLEVLIRKLNKYGKTLQVAPPSPWFGAAVGVYPRSGPSALQKVDRVVKAGASVLFVETQQANSQLVMDFCKTVKQLYPQLQVVVGVFNSVEGIKRAIKVGADAVKVGIGAGDACLTTTMSGVSKGQVNTVFEISDYFKNHKSVPVIIDGGTSSPGGAAIMMTILQGNGCIMLGSKIASVHESDAIKFRDRKTKTTYALVEGMGSKPIADKRFEPKDQRILEGTVIRKIVRETLDELLLRYEGGFRTAMYGYHGADNWKELASRATLALNSHSNSTARLFKEDVTD